MISIRSGTIRRYGLLLGPENTKINLAAINHEFSAETIFTVSVDTFVSSGAV